MSLLGSFDPKFEMMIILIGLGTELNYLIKKVQEQSVLWYEYSTDIVQFLKRWRFAVRLPCLLNYFDENILW